MFHALPHRVLPVLFVTLALASGPVFASTVRRMTTTMGRMGEIV